MRRAKPVIDRRNRAELNFADAREKIRFALRGCLAMRREFSTARALVFERAKISNYQSSLRFLVTRVGCSRANGDRCNREIGITRVSSASAVDPKRSAFGAQLPRTGENRTRTRRRSGVSATASCSRSSTRELIVAFRRSVRPIPRRCVARHSRSAFEYNV